MGIDISIVIPAYNEESRIVPTMEKIIDFVQNREHKSFEIVVVDDGSSDKTADVVKGFAAHAPYIRLLKNEINSGKGASVKKGVMDARGDVIYFTDADLSTPIEELDRFFAEIKDADIVIGSRAIDGADIVVHEPFYREILGKVFCGIVRAFCVPGFIDTQCGAKMFRKEAARKIFPFVKISRFAFDVEVLYLAHVFGYKVKELPVKWFYSSNTRVRPFVDGPKMLLDLLQIRWSHRNIK